MRNYTPSQTSAFAHKMRTLPTSTESKLFNALTENLKHTVARVHLQHIIGPYIADLFIPYAALIIEVDGASHAGRKEYDERRENYMRRRGYRTVRFKNIEVWQDCTAVLGQIRDACGEIKESIPGNVKITYCPPMRASGHKKRLRLL